MFERDLLRLPLRLLSFLLLLLSMAGAVSAAARIEIRGVVTADGGRGRAGAAVRLEPVVDDYRRGVLALAGRPGPEPADVYRTGTDGRFLLAAPRPGMWRVVVEAPGAVPVERRLIPLFEDAALPAVEPPEDAGLTVTVVDAEGRPVPQARVRWTAADAGPAVGALTSRGWLLHPRTGTTNAAGRLRLPRAAGQPGTARAWAPGFLPSEPVALPGGEDSATLPLATGRERTLRVHDPAGQSLGDVLVRLAAAGVELGTTDAEGRLTAVLPTSGSVDLLLDAGGGWRRRLRVELPDAPPAGPAADGSLDLTLDAPLLLTGQVVDADDGSPLAGALVWPRGEAGAAVTSGEDGSYEMIAGALPDQVAGAAAGYRAAAVRAEDTRSGRLPLLSLPPAVLLEGTLSDPQGAPVAGARVRLRTPAHPGLTWDGFGTEVPGARSDDRGRFRVVGLDAGAGYLLRVEADGFPALERPVEPPARLRLVLEPGGGLAATVMDPYGAPVRGARVRLFPGPEEGEQLTVQIRGGELIAQHEGRTGRDGRFVLRDVAAGRYDLRIDASGLAPLRRMGVEVPQGELHDLGLLTAEPAVAVSGRVVDGAGEPVAGARVSVNPFSPYREWRGSRSIYTFSPQTGATQVGGVVSDAEGRFRLDGLAAGDLVDLDVQHERYQGQTVRGVEPPVDELEVALEAGVRVRGRVLDPSGRAVARAQVRLNGESSIQTSGGQSSFSYSHAAMTDEDGRFDVAGLNPGTLSVEVLSDDLAPATAGPFDTASGDSIGPLELQLGEPVALSGTVVGLDGEPVPGVAVTARLRTPDDDGPTRSWHREVRTGPAGSYRIPGPPRGEYEVSADAGTARAEATVEIGERSRRLDLQLEEHRALAGRVVRSDGGPALEPRVAIYPSRGDGENPALSFQGDDDGSFVWSDPPQGSYRIVATAGDERGTLEVEVGADPPRDLLVRLRPGAEVRGRIDGVEPAAAHRVQVTARPAGGGRLRFGRTDRSGDYRVGGLSPGAWTVTASLAGTGRAEGEVEITDPGETARLDLELEAGTRVHGRVTLDGEPLAGAHVELAPVDDAAGSRSTNALHDGSFTIAGLDDGRYRVRVAGDFAAPRWLREVDLSGDEELHLDLEAVAVSGRVLAADGAPVAGARVALGPPGGDRGNFYMVVHSDDLGLFRIPEALPGSYVLRVEAPGFEPVETPLQVDVLDVGGLEVVLGS